MRLGWQSHAPSSASPVTSERPRREAESNQLSLFAHCDRLTPGFDRSTGLTAGVARAAERSGPSVTDSEWTIRDDAAGIRLDKFLAHEGRLGSRARAAAAIARGKVFLNGA